MKVVAIETVVRPRLIAEVWERIPQLPPILLHNHLFDVAEANEDAAFPRDDIQRAFSAAASLRHLRNSLQLREHSVSPKPSWVGVLGYIDSAWLHVGDINAVRFSRYFADATEGYAPDLTVLFTCADEGLAVDNWKQTMQILTGRASLDLSNYLVVDIAKRPDLLQELARPEDPATAWGRLVQDIERRVLAT